jgi:hypothetical protein
MLLFLGSKLIKIQIKGGYYKIFGATNYFLRARHDFLS